MATIIAAIQYPALLRREQSLLWQKDFQNQVSPPALDGTQQTRNITGGGIWRAQYGNVTLRRPEHILAWEGLATTLKGGMVPIDVPLLWCGLAPWPLDAAGRKIMVIPVGGFTDGLPSFNDGTGVDMSVIFIETVGTPAARAQAMRIKLRRSGEVLPGMCFSYYDVTTYGWRMYSVGTVAAVGGQPTQRDITFWPPLRTAIANAVPLAWDAPRNVMRLAESNSMDMDLQLRKQANVSAKFSEAF
jgi:hypothetical protein